MFWFCSIFTVLYKTIPSTAYSAFNFLTELVITDSYKEVFEVFKLSTNIYRMLHQGRERERKNEMCWKGLD